MSPAEQVHQAQCGCGAVQLACSGEPVRVSVCHCLDCQRRSGSAFSAQVRFAEADVTIAGETNSWTKIGDSGGEAEFRFCPKCGSTVAYVIDALPGLVAVPIGAFAAPGLFRAPDYSVYESRMHPWVAVVGDSIERY